ncbi:methyltransferase protein, partial [Serendipita sp. 399]
MAQVPLATVFTQQDLEAYSESSASASYIGSEETSALLELYKTASQDGYDLICVPLTNETWRTRWKRMCLTDESGKQSEEIEKLAEDWRASEGPFLREEMNITRLDEATGCIGMVSEWLEIDSLDDGMLLRDTTKALKQELSFASYLNLQSVILPPPRNRQYVADYGRAVNACLTSTSSYLHISIRMPIYDPRSASRTSISEETLAENVPLSVHARAPDGDLSSTWEMWDVIRTICGYNPRLSLTLDLSLPLPNSAGILSRWATEPCHHIFLPATSFISNAKGYPVLTKATQGFLRSLLNHNPTILFSRTKANVHQNGGHVAYAQYFRHLERTSPQFLAAQKPGTIENYAKGYWDYLQAPLQPLMDNLGSGTYETFERDPVKYERYEEAIFLALCDRSPNSRTVICLVGAGRGGIVTRCLAALDRSNRDGVVYAVEKNPNAYVTLQEQRLKWGNRVNLIYGDMRKINVPEQADILVSELLGSFGDNEASPECLDGAMRFLKRTDGISIPSSYTSYLSPVSSARLHNEVLQNNGRSGPETPYVVMFQAVNTLSGEGGGLRGLCGTKVQECWTFTHPRRDAVINEQGLPITNTHNTRSARLNFHIPNAGVLHGLAGYFEAVLYGDIGISIHPETQEHVSPNMLSWFPLYFPFKEPLYLPSNSELHVSIWRLTSKSKIWYEWYAESYLPVFLTPNVPSPLASAIPSPTSTMTSGRNGWNTRLSIDSAPGGIRMGAEESVGFNDSTPGSHATVIKIEETRLENDEHPSVQQDDVETPMAPRLEEPSEESLRKDEGEPIEPSKKVEIIPEDVPASVPESDPPDDTTPNMKGSSSNGPVVDNESPAPIATEETTRPETVTIPANLTEQAVEELSKWTGNDDSSARLLERLNRGLEIPISHVLDVDYQSSSLATNPPDTPRLTSEVQSRSSTASFSRSSLYRQIDESLRDGVSPEEQNELINVRLALGLANPPHVEVSSNILDRSSSVVPLGPSTPKSAAWSTGESSWDSNDRLNGTGDATPTKEYPPSSNTGPIKEPSSVTETNNPSDPQQGITEEDLPAQSDPRDMLSTRLEIGLQTPVQAKSISLPAPTESVTALPPSTPRPEDLSSSSSDSLTRDLEIQNGDSLAPALHATDTLPTEEKENEKPDVAQQSSYVSTPPSQNDPEQLAIDPSVPPDSHIEATPAVVDDGPDNVGVSPVSRSLVPDKAAPLAPEEPLDRVDQPGEIVDEVSKPLAEEESKNEVHSDSVPKGSGDGAPTEGDGDVSVKGTSSAIPDAEPQA